MNEKDSIPANPPLNEGSQQSKPGQSDPPDDLQLQEIDPNGPPQAVHKVTRGLNLTTGATIVLVAGASTMYILGGSVQSTRGATRSSRLLWQQRQAEIQAVMATDHCDEAGQDDPGGSGLDEDASG